MFKERLMKHLAKKGAKDLDPMDQKAKLDVVGEMHRQASSQLGKKVGLKKAVEEEDAELEHPGGKEGVEGSPKEEASESHSEAIAEGDIEGSPDEEATESPEEESKEDIEAEHAGHSPEQLDSKIQHLMNLKHKKQSGRA